MCCPSREFVGAVGRVVKTPLASFTPDTSAYAAGDAMYGSTLALDCAVAESGGSGVVVEVALWEAAGSGSAQKKGIRLFFLRANQTGLVINTAYAAPAEFSDILGYVDIITANYIDVGAGKAMAVVQAALNIRPTSGQTIYVVPVALEAVTYAAASTIKIEPRIISD